MARLSDVYKSKNNREIVLTDFQAQVFEETIEKFKREGVGGDDIFEETYVLQKDIAEYITGNVTSGGGGVPGFATATYNFILGIETAAPVIPDPVIEEIDEPDEELIQELTPLPESPLVKPGKKRPKNIPFRDLRPKGRPFRPKSMAEFLANRGGIRKPVGKPRRNPLEVARSIKSAGFSGFGESPAGGRSMADFLRKRGGTNFFSKFGPRR